MSFKIAEAYVEVTTRDNTAAGAAAIQSRLNRLRGTAKVDVDVDTSSMLRARGHVTAFGNSMSRHGGRSLAIFAAITAAAPLAAAAIAAVPAALASLTGIGGVLVGTFSGVGGALKAYAEDQETAAKASTQNARTELSNARQIRDAQESIADARRNQARVAEDAAERITDAQENEVRVAEAAARDIADARRDQARASRDGADAIATASRRVEDAIEREADAQRDLTRAQADAQRQLESLTERVHDLALDQEGAAIAVVKAQQRYDAIMADATTTDMDRREAAYDLAVAQERVRDNTREQTEASTELNEANARGVNGADQVIAAQERVADAHQGVLDAQVELGKTQRDVAEAQEEAARRVAQAISDGADAQREAAERTAEAVEDSAEAQEDAARAVAQAVRNLNDVQQDQAAAMAAAAVEANKYAAAMAKLSPEQRRLVEQLLRMKPLISQLGDAGARGFIPGLIDMLRDSEGLFPIFNTHLERTGTIMGDSARKMGELFRSEEFKQNLDRMFKASEPITRALGDGFVSLTNTLVRAGAELAPVSEAFARFIDHTFAGLDRLFTALAENKDTFARFLDIAGRLLEQLLPAIIEVAAVIADILSPALEALVGWMEAGDGRASALILTLMGLFVLVKGVGLVKSVAGWAKGVIGFFDDIGKSAEKNKGKVGKLSGALKGIGVLVGAQVVGQGLDAVTDEGPSDRPFDEWSNKEKLNDMGDTAAKVLTLDFGGVFAKLKRDIDALPGDLERLGVKVDEKMRWIFGDGLVDDADRFGAWIDSLVGINDAGNTSMLNGTQNNMTLMADATNEGGATIVDRFTAWISGLPDSVGGWFTDMRDRAGGKLTELRDDADGKASQLWDGLSGWWSRLGDDASNWFGGMRDRAGDRLRELKDNALARGNELWQGLTGWWNRLRDDTGNILWDLRNRVVDGPLKSLIDGFWKCVDAIGEGWRRLGEVVRAPVAFVVNQVWNKVNDLWGGQDVLGFASGGRVPGTGDRDSVPAMLAPDEFVVRKKVAKPHLRFLEALNAGQTEAVQAAGGPNGRMQYFAEGGAVQRGVGWARAQHGKPYVWGGVGPGGYDCSGFMSAITNVLLGKNPHSRIGATGSMPWPGFTNGLNSMFGLGWFTGSPGHTAGTLAGHNVESGGSPSMTKFVQNAAGALHRQFNRHMSLPMAGGEFIGGGPGGGGDPGWLRRQVESTFRSLTDPLINRLPAPPPGLNELPKGTVRSVRDQALTKALDLVGFDGGGWLNPGLSAVFNGTGKPERVLSAGQTQAFERFVSMIQDWYRWRRWEPPSPGGLEVAARGGGGDPVGSSVDAYGNRNVGNVTVNVVQQSGSPAETGRFVALALRGVG